MQVVLHHADLDIESNEVTIELVLIKVEQLVGHSAEVLHMLVELLDDRLDALELVLAKGTELLNRRKQ
jgi:hypothetical protein